MRGVGGLLGRGSSVDARLLPFRSPAIALLAALALMIWAAPAVALQQRGHSFGGSFGEGILSGPSAVAVNETTGDVYVLDAANNRVVVFGPGPQHAFIEAWGWGVAAGKDSYEQCKVQAECKAGRAGYGKGEFDDPVSIAVDNVSGSPSKGDVYVVANGTIKKAVVDKFKPTGELIDRLFSKKDEKEESENAIVAVAVAPAGEVWVEREDGEEEFELQRFDSSVLNQPIGEPAELEIERLEGTRPARPGLAVDAAGNAYVTYEPEGADAAQVEEEEEEILEREHERKHNHEELKHEKPQQPCQEHACLVAELAISLSEEPVEAKPLLFQLDGENSTGVALDASTGKQGSGDVYLDNATSVASFTAAGALIQHFGGEQLAKGGGMGLAVDAVTGEVLVADAAEGRVDAYTPSPPGPPTVESGSVLAAHVSAESAELRATIDPSGADTHYRFQYCSEGTSDCHEAPEPPAPEGDAGEGYGDVRAAVKLTGLQAATTYHVKLVAQNRLAEGSQAVESETHSFTTLPAAVETKLPDSRQWELVSPASKDGASIEPIQIEGGLVQAASDGKALAFTTSAPLGEGEVRGNRAPESSQIFAERSPSGWSSQDITTPNTAAHGIRVGLTREWEAFSSNLEQGLVVPPDEQALSEGAPEGDVYLRDDFACPTQPSGRFEPLVTTANDTAKHPFGSSLSFSGATPNLQHVVIHAEVPLTMGAQDHQLYEWSEGQLALVSELPEGGESDEQVSLGGGESEMASTAISRDGSRVVWRVNAGPLDSGNGHLYMREVPQAHTLQVDEPDGGAPTPKLGPRPLFQTANNEGTRVFFTDPQRLTSTSTAREAPEINAPQDLYLFEAEKPAGERITDLTIPLNSGESAGVQGAVLGASEDGSTIYFVANGVLAPGASPGDCRVEAPTGAACSVYVAHDGPSGWETKFIARVSSEDSPDWGRLTLGYYLKLKTSQASGNGAYLAFMSSESLTGYNNVDENSGARDEEVFLYHYEEGEAGTLVCASCNPSGAQPVGVLDTEESGEGRGPAGRSPGNLERRLRRDRSLAGRKRSWMDQRLPAAVLLPVALHQ